MHHHNPAESNQNGIIKQKHNNDKNITSYSKHYLKMAIAKFKNKIQYLLFPSSEVSRTSCFSMTSYYIRKIQQPSLLLGQTAIGWRIYMPNQPNTVMRTLIIPGEVVQELMGNPITGIGQINIHTDTAKPMFPYQREPEKNPVQCSTSECHKRFSDHIRHSNVGRPDTDLKPGEVFISPNHP